MNRDERKAHGWSTPILPSFPVEKVYTLLLGFSSLLLSSLTNGTSISAFQCSPKVWDFAAPGSAFIRECGCGWWWMFQSISLLLGTSGGAQGDRSLWKAVTHYLNDYATRRNKKPWLCSVPFLFEGCWVRWVTSHSVLLTGNSKKKKEEKPKIQTHTKTPQKALQGHKPPPRHFSLWAVFPFKGIVLHLLLLLFFLNAF